MDFCSCTVVTQDLLFKAWAQNLSKLGTVPCMTFTELHWVFGSYVIFPVVPPGVQPDHSIVDFTAWQVIFHNKQYLWHPNDPHLYKDQLLATLDSDEASYCTAQFFLTTGVQYCSCQNSEPSFHISTHQYCRPTNICYADISWSRTWWHWILITLQ